jgi:N4-gp56 family major capsid protein
MAGTLPDNAQTTADLDAGLQAQIDESTIIAESQYIVWTAACDREDPLDVGTGIVYPLLGALDPVSAPLDLDVNPASIDLADDTASITVDEYGNPAHLAARINRASKTQSVQGVIDGLTQNMAESVDLICGTAAVAGTVVRLADGVANAAALTAAGIMDRNEVIAVRATLKASRAPLFPDGFYRAILSPYSVSDIFASGSLSDFTDTAKYTDPNAILTGEIGTWLGFRFFEASQANLTDNGAGAAGGGNTVGDLVKAVFCGMRYCRSVVQERPAVRVKPLGDSMDRFLSVYWKGLFGFGRIRNSNGVVWKGRSAFAPHA